MSKSNAIQSEQLTDSMYYILLSLLEERHGYAIMKFIEDLSEQEVNMGPGTLYTLLKKLLKAGWIEQISNDRTKIYKITKVGFDLLSQEIARRKRLVKQGERVMKEIVYEE